MHEEIARSLRGLAAPEPGPRGVDCPPERDLEELAAGVLPSERTDAVLDHATNCGHCGPLLRQAVEDFSAEVSPEEETVLAQLESARPGYAVEIGGRLAAQTTGRRGAREGISVTPTRRGWLFWPAWALAAAAVGLMALGALWTYRRMQPAYAEQLLADAYAEQRTLELRIPGARPAPMRVERGGGDRSNLSRPAALLEAEALIARELAKHPSDPRWLAERGRAELLDWQYEAAIKSFKRALDAQPDSPPLLRDLATAYFQRAEAQDRAIDYGEAIELLGESLAKQPDDPVALYNRAIACEKMFLYQQAIEDWEHYLRVDPTGAWAEEAKKILASLREKTSQHEKDLSQPLLTPAQITGAGPRDSAIERALEARIEDYLNVAVRDWLPESLPDSSLGKPQQAAYQASLAYLARVMQREHQDSWLSDLLSYRNRPAFSAAIRALSQAAIANASTDFAAARNHAQSAQRLFAAAGNLPGVLRSQYEEVFALHQSSRGRECLKSAHLVAQKTGELPYGWMRAQIWLEQGACWAILGDLGQSQRMEELAEREATRSRYGNVYLRAAMANAELAVQRGERRTAWAIASAGLSRYWSGRYKRMAGYGLYTNLDSVADSLRQPHLQLCIWRQADELIQSDPALLLRAMAHRWTGYAAFSAGMSDLAEKEFAEASRLLEAAPPSDAVRADYADAEIWLARLEGMRGNTREARARLERVGPFVRLEAANYAALHYYVTLGDLEIPADPREKTESALRAAIHLAEYSLHSLTSERERAAWNKEASGVYRKLVAVTLRAGDARQALEIWEWYRGAALRAADAPLSVDQNPQSKSSWRLLDAATLAQGPPLPEFHAVADIAPTVQRETVLVYAVLPDGLAIWVYDDRGIASRYVNIWGMDLQMLAAHFVESCSDPRSDPADLRAESRRLYDLLIAPVENHLLPGRALVIEADDRVSNIPMEALLDAQGHFLGERGPIVSSPGLYLMKPLRAGERISSEAETLVVASGPSQRPGLLPTQGIVEEARSTAQSFHKASILEGRAATATAVKQGLRRAQVFHFAGHGVESPDQAGLFVAEGPQETGVEGVFDVDSLEAADLRNLQLAVLSACSSAIGSEGGAGDYDSLARGLLRFGVPHVVASRWPVDSTVAAKFMKDFYQRLLSGEPVSRSLWEAQSDLREQPETVHPSYWAAFSSFGRS
jgi:CHAT domain-containing protein/tetratricopeptide (TPR) repeat protein